MVITYFYVKLTSAFLQTMFPANPCYVVTIFVTLNVGYRNLLKALGRFGTVWRTDHRTMPITLRSLLQELEDLPTKWVVIGKEVHVFSLVVTMENGAAKRK